MKLNSAYDLAIVYRIYPGISKTPPIYADSKLKMSELCLRSFANSLKNIKAKIWVIFDGCPDVYTKMFDEVLNDFDCEYIHTNKIGNGATFDMQMNILLEQNYSETIYFAEDDYFYLPNAFEKLLDFKKSNDNVHFLTPFDHADYYILNFHKVPTSQTQHNGRRWTKRISTTMTFMTSKEILKQTKKVFDSYAKRNFDASLWLVITSSYARNLNYLVRVGTESVIMFKTMAKAFYFTPTGAIFGKRYNLFVPSPSLANHLDVPTNAPGIDWDKEYEKYEIKY